jgi:hypothetical protein
MTSHIKYIKENIEKFVSTHDSVIQLQVRVTTVERENHELKQANENLRNSVQSLWVKVAGISGVISFLVAIFSSIGSNGA